MKTSKWVGILAVVMTLLVLLLVWARWQKEHSRPATVPLSPAAVSMESLALNVPVEQEKGNPDILTRPVFWKERGPYVAPTPRQVRQKPVKVGPDSFDQVKLLGTYGADGKTSLIVISTEGTQRVMMGDDLAGWIFNSMNAEGAVFSQDGEQRTLVMQKPTPPTKEELAEQAAELKARTEVRISKATNKMVLENKPGILSETEMGLPEQLVEPGMEAPSAQAKQPEREVVVPSSTSMGDTQPNPEPSGAEITFESIWEERARKSEASKAAAAEQK